MRFSILLAGLAAVAAVACGGSDEGGKGGGSTTPGKVESGAPASTPANQLTDAQVKSFCDSASQAFGATLSSGEAQQGLCGFSAYFVASLGSASGGGDPAATCKMVYDECLKTPPQSTQEECTKPSATCTATVGEIEACLNDSMAQLQQMLKSLPGCDDVGTQVEDPMLGTGEQPASCQVVQQKCPEALDEVPDLGSMVGG